MIGQLSLNPPGFRELIAKVTLEEIGLGNIGLVELIFETLAKPTTFPQLLILCHYMALSNKSDLLKAMWVVYGIPENARIGQGYGLNIGDSCIDDLNVKSTNQEQILSCLKKNDPNAIYWISKCEDYCFDFVFDTIDEIYPEYVSGEMLDILGGFYEQSLNIMFLLYPVGLILGRFKTIVKPTLPSLNEEQLYEIETIQKRIPKRQPVINTKRNEHYRSDISISEVGDKILRSSNDHEIRDYFRI